MINYKIRNKIEADSFDWLLEFISQYISKKQDGSYFLKTSFSKLSESFNE